MYDDAYDDFYGYPRFRSTKPSKITPLNTEPHYSDPGFESCVTMYGNPNKPGMAIHYSDRLEQNNYSKYDASIEAARKSGAPRKSVRFYEAMLSAYTGVPCLIHYIGAGVNRSSGYSYQVFGYTMDESEKKAEW